MPSVIIVGGGLAGLAAAAALGEAGYQVQLFEALPFPGGRATSYRVPPVARTTDPLDNGQHVLFRCCVNLLDFYERVGVRDQVAFHRRFYFLEPGGRLSQLEAGRLRAPWHFAGSFAGLPFLGWKEKLAVARALRALIRERRTRRDLDRITMADWLAEKRQPPAARHRFWRPILVGAVNEEPGRMAARYGFQVMWRGFLARADSYHLGVPRVPLAELCGLDALGPARGVTVALRTPVERFLVDGGRVRGVQAAGRLHSADWYVSAVPFERVPELAPELGLDFSGWEHSPITGIHLWFDRPVTELPQAALVGGAVDWFFNKDGGRHLQLVVSASRRLVPMRRSAIISLAERELRRYVPGLRGARLEAGHVAKHLRATFSARPGLEARRPGPVTRLPNLFLAGDWTRTGWPATMEGAVRSGYRAAEAVTAAAGRPRRFLVPDLAGETVAGKLSAG